MDLRAQLHRQIRDDRGVAAPVLALLLAVLLGFAAISLDQGNNWQRERSLSTAVDSAALAAAGTYAIGGNGCGDDAADYLNANDDRAVLISCLANGTDRFGWVTVRAETTVDPLFAGALGLGSSTITIERTALWGSPIEVDLAPAPLFHACLSTLIENPAFLRWQVTGRSSAPIQIPLAGNYGDCESSAFDELDLRMVVQQAGAQTLIPILNSDLTTVGHAAVELLRINHDASTDDLDFIEVVFLASTSDGPCCARPDESSPELHRRATRLATLDSDGLPVRRS